MENYDNMMAGTSREGRENDSRYLKTGKLVFASRIFRRVRKIKKKKAVEFPHTSKSYSWMEAFRILNGKEVGKGDPLKFK